MINSKTKAPRLRLTQRGRIVLAVFVTLLMLAFAVFAMVLSASQAGATQEGFDQSPVVFETIAAQPGDTLWSIATKIAPKHDPRDVINELVRFNQLDGVDLLAGQELAIPASYSAR